MDGMTIGNIAKQAGVSRVTLRYYERVGLLPKATRKTAGYRFYPKTTIARVHFIQKAKFIGFSLKEIAELLALHDAGSETSMPVRNKVKSKIDEVQNKIADLKTMAKVLRQLLDSCDGMLPISQCPIIQNIYNDKSDS